MNNSNIIPLTPNNPDRFTLDSADNLAEAGKSLPKRRKLLGEFIFERQLIHFPSERGTGKTFFLLQLCLAISKLYDSFVGEKIDRYGNTLFLSFEMGKEDIMERLADLYNSSPNPLYDEKFHECSVLTSKEDFTSIYNEVIDIIKKHRPVLVVLDNFSIAFTDIEKRKEIAIAWRNLLKMKDDYGFALVIVDHTKKNTTGQKTNSDMQSGSGVKSDLSDGDIFIRFSSQDVNLRLLTTSKARRTARRTGAKLIRFNPDTLWFELVKENVNELEHLSPDVAKNMDEQFKYDIAKTLKEAGHSYETIGNAIGIPRSTLHRKLS